MEQASVDILGGKGGGSGEVAMRLLEANFNVSALRTNAVLRKDEWIRMDERVIAVARQRLIGVGDLLSRGLRFPIEDALGITRVEWERVSDFGVANVNMSGVAEGESDRILFDLASVPLPIVHKDFNINIRALHASRNGSTPLDLTQLELATRIVAEKNEDILFNGGINIGANGVVEGYNTATNRITGDLAAAWSTATGAQMLADMQTIIGLLYAQNMFGPYLVYVPTAWYIALNDDYKAESDKTILERLLQHPDIEGIKPTSNLTDRIVVAQMTSDVVDMIDGMQPTVVSWESHGGMVMNFKVMSILVPRMKSTYASQSGIAVYAEP